MQKKLSYNELMELEEITKEKDIYQQRIAQKPTMTIDEFIAILKKEMEENEGDLE